jgi:AcrR family transcriptional regulator
MKRLTNRQKQADASKRKIFVTAINLFSQNAYEDITVNDICKAAGLSVGAFYHHFKNKESILNEGFRLFDLDIEKLWIEAHPTPGRASIEFLIHGQMQSMSAMGVTAASQYFKNQLSNAEKYIIDKDRFFYRTLLSNVRHEIEQGTLHGEAGVITDDILCLTRGGIYDWCLHDGCYDLVLYGYKALNMALQYYCLE